MSNASWAFFWGIISVVALCWFVVSMDRKVRTEKYLDANRDARIERLEVRLDSLINLEVE